MKRVYAGLAVFILFLSGCDRYDAHVRVVRANYNVSRGDYQSAIVDYLRAADVSSYDPWISYNLGNVYHSLGESEVALEMWTASQDADVPDLLFGSAFNRGVYYFEQGLYSRAVEQFRYALRLDGSSISAKRNLELSMEKLRAESELTSNPEAGEASLTAEAAGGGRILDYIRRKEEQQWRSNAETTPGVEELDW